MQKVIDLINKLFENKLFTKIYCNVPFYLFQNSIQNQDSNIIENHLLQDISSAKQVKNICDLKPMLVTDNNKDSGEVKELHSENETSNVIHIVVEATEESPNIIQENM